MHWLFIIFIWSTPAKNWLWLVGGTPSKNWSHSSMIWQRFCQIIDDDKNNTFFTNILSISYHLNEIEDFHLVNNGKNSVLAISRHHRKKNEPVNSPTMISLKTYFSFSTIWKLFTFFGCPTMSDSILQSLGRRRLDFKTPISLGCHWNLPSSYHAKYLIHFFFGWNFPFRGKNDGVLRVFDHEVRYITWIAHLKATHISLSRVRSGRMPENRQENCKR